MSPFFRFFVLGTCLTLRFTFGDVESPKTVTSLELEKYMGTWYEIARFPFRQQDGCFNTTAHYALNADGTVKVTNRCRKGSFTGPQSTAVARAKVSASDNAKLKVKFFAFAPWADYWVLQLGKSYEYAVVSQPTRKYLWILSRTPSLDGVLYNDILNRLKEDHFEIERLIKTPQDWTQRESPNAKFTESISPYLNGLALTLGLMTLVWFLSLWKKDASLVDRFWGMGFIAITIQGLLQSRFLTFRGALIFSLVTLWGLRLSLYIHFRNRKKPEDVRYQNMRRAYGPTFWWKSFFIVFALQGFLMWVIAAPLAVIHLFPQPDEPTLLDFIGVAFWFIGFAFEAIGDYQLAKFKGDPSHRGQVCRKGLWNLTRHPNYFGESLLWWGTFLISLNVDYAYFTVFSPLLMTFLLLKVSGVTLLEKQLKSTKQGYDDYVREVPAFFPRWKLK